MSTQNIEQLKNMTTEDRISYWDSIITSLNKNHGAPVDSQAVMHQYALFLETSEQNPSSRTLATVIVGNDWDMIPNAIPPTTFTFPRFQTLQDEVDELRKQVQKLEMQVDEKDLQIEITGWDMEKLNRAAEEAKKQSRLLSAQLEDALDEIYKLQKHVDQLRRENAITFSVPPDQRRTTISNASTESNMVCAVAFNQAVPPPPEPRPATPESSFDSFQSFASTAPPSPSPSQVQPRPAVQAIPRPLPPPRPAVQAIPPPPPPPRPAVQAIPPPPPPPPPAVQGQAIPADQPPPPPAVQDQANPADQVIPLPSLQLQVQWEPAVLDVALGAAGQAVAAAAQAVGAAFTMDPKHFIDQKKRLKPVKDSIQENTKPQKARIISTFLGTAAFKNGTERAAVVEANQCPEDQVNSDDGFESDTESAQPEAAPQKAAQPEAAPQKAAPQKAADPQTLEDELKLTLKKRRKAVDG